MKIEVTRPFCLAGERLEIGYQAEVDDRFARELIHNGKAAKVEEAAPAAEAPAEAPAARRRKAAQEGAE
jgi:hypothetical protein